MLAEWDLHDTALARQLFYCCYLKTPTYAEIIIAGIVDTSMGIASACVCVRAFS